MMIWYPDLSPPASSVGITGVYHYIQLLFLVLKAFRVKSKVSTSSTFASTQSDYILRLVFAILLL